MGGEPPAEQIRSLALVVSRDRFSLSALFTPLLHPIKSLLLFKELAMGNHLCRPPAHSGPNLTLVSRFQRFSTFTGWVTVYCAL